MGLPAVPCRVTAGRSSVCGGRGAETHSRRDWVRTHTAGAGSVGPATDVTDVTVVLVAVAGE